MLNLIDYEELLQIKYTSLTKNVDSINISIFKIYIYFRFNELYQPLDNYLFHYTGKQIFWTQ